MVNDAPAQAGTTGDPVVPSGDLPPGESLFRLDGTTVVVVGAGGGIGRAVARGVADHGARVVCADLDEAAADTTAHLVTERGGRATSVAVDITDREQVDALAAAHGGAEGLVVTPAVNVRKSLLDYTRDEFDRVVDLNLAGTFQVLQAFGATMRDRGSGSIVVFSSIRSTVVEPGQGVYAATKAGVVQLVTTLAAELGPDGVRVNAIAPGIVATPLTNQIKADQEWADAYASKSVFGRWARPEELVGPVVFLLSDASSYVTASELAVDGGWTRVDGRFTPPLP